MKIFGKKYKTIWFEENKCLMINQNKLPFTVEILSFTDYKSIIIAIKNMTVRGAGAIGVAAGFAMAIAAKEAEESKTDYIQFIKNAANEIKSARPTAQNLFWAVDIVLQKAETSSYCAMEEALILAEENELEGYNIAKFGAELINDGDKILTHCNAGWLAFVDWGSALAPIYFAKEQGKNIFVYVDETRPRLQGSRLTAFELYHEGIPHKIIADNAAGYFMAEGKIDFVITGADRIAKNGDTANKIGTLEKAVLAKEFGLPFYIAAPLSTFDNFCVEGKDIPIEFRNKEEILKVSGNYRGDVIHDIQIANVESEAINPAFDVTPYKYISSCITDRGIVKPDISQNQVKKYSFTNLYK